ncbi:hypothetical protein D1Z77_26465 [Escherichia coli]|nr:hypothetical protein [Escherichia coli]
MFHTIVSIKNDGHYFCRAGGNRPDGLNEPVTVLLHTILNFSMYCRCLISSHTGKLVWVSDKYVKLTAPQYQPHAVSR